MKRLHLLSAEFRAIPHAAAATAGGKNAIEGPGGRCIHAFVLTGGCLCNEPVKTKGTTEGNRAS